jgi:MOSC domain-containing protein YiiM
MEGRLIAIRVTPEYGADLESPTEALLIEDHGIEGDRYAGTVRQVTLISTRSAAVASAEFGAPIDAASTRRNLVIEADEIPSKHGTGITIGDAALTVWRECAPCELMDAIFGEGARQALKRRTGVSARGVSGGTIHVGDPVTVATKPG